MALSVKNLPAVQETQLQFLGQEVPLEKEMVTHSSIPAWESPCTEEPGGYSPWGHRSRTLLATKPPASGLIKFFKSMHDILGKTN